MADAPRPRDAALRSNSPIVWPGCHGNGRHMECGRIHDFGYYNGKGDWVPRFACARNWNSGCPDPMPEPTKALATWVPTPTRRRRDA